MSFNIPMMPVLSIVHIIMRMYLLCCNYDFMDRVVEPIKCMIGGWWLGKLLDCTMFMQLHLLNFIWLLRQFTTIFIAMYLSYSSCICCISILKINKH